ncbi:hypothetical protein [Vibrio mexicanus]|uniref:hypothetical protein n=1 Tax=Vibrio mexicanus TaxID=1004326 RepID=UPI00063C0FA0|nr:hypothetical protein [Vibrio mexicanus]
MEQTSQRIRYIAIFTVEEAVTEQACNSLGQRLSESFGGVTVFTGEGCNGFWSKNANEYLARYSAEVKKERVIIIQLSVMPDSAKQALESLKMNITQICNDLNASTQYVHIESETVTAHHFKLTC